MIKNQSLVKLRKVSKVFLRGSVDEVTALDNVRLDVGAEDFITVIGSNGAGKTTLLNVIAGVYPPEKGGKITINGQDVTRLSEHKRARYVSRVYQNPHIGTAAKMTIEENLSLAMLRGQSRGLRIATNKKRRELFRSVLVPLGLGLEDRLSALVGTLSGGQRQALTLLMATWLKPKLLLLDEHTAALDPKSASQVIRLSEEIIVREKLTTLMVTHSMHQAANLGDRLIMMYRGRIIHDFRGAEKKRLRVDDLLARFEEVRRREQLDPTAAEMLRRTYI